MSKEAGAIQGALGMHFVAEYIIDVVKDHFVIEHGGLSLGICRSILAYHTLKAAPRLVHMWGWLSTLREDKAPEIFGKKFSKNNASLA